jgi:hypothetical protein
LGGFLKRFSKLQTVQSKSELLRVGILLIGGDKTGSERWYEEHVPTAERLFDGHVDQLD